MTNEDALAQGGNLSIPRHVKKAPASKSDMDTASLDATWAAFDEGGREFWTEMDSFVERLDGIVAEETSDA